MKIPIIMLAIIGATAVVPRIWSIDAADRDAVRQAVHAWTAEHQDEIQAVVREVMLSRSRVGALAAAAETTDATRVDGSIAPRRSYWQ